MSSEAASSSKDYYGDPPQLLYDLPSVSDIQHKCPVLATRCLLSFFILSSTLLRGLEVWKSLTE